MVTSTPTDPLARYWAKRDFTRTAEPRGEHAPSGARLTFVVQKHAASRLHYDFRLELGGVLLSWAVPKGPSLDPADKRIAIRVEDHPLSYGTFEGTIPPKQYGAGSVIVWDTGTWEPVGDPVAGLAKGKVLFKLHGQKLDGLWELVNIAKGGEKQEPWILFKKRDDFARSKADYDVLTALPDSVIAKPLRAPVLSASAKTKKAPAANPPTPSAERAGKHRADRPPGAVKAPLPDKLSPQLATLATSPPAGEWIYEIKFDGYRLMARIEKTSVRLITRGGHDWSAKMPTLVAELGALGIKSAWLDGEIVVLGDDGVPDFNALQNAFDRPGSTAAIDYFVFDLPYFGGFDLRDATLRDRRTVLRALVQDSGAAHLRYSADFDADAHNLLASARKLNLEGVIAKRADAKYVSRRSETWLKLKLKHRQEFVVGGYTDRSDGSPQIGSLLLGVYTKEGVLQSVGSVGTGWSAKEAAELKSTLVKIETAKSPFPADATAPGRWSKRVAGTERWVKPTSVAEVEFADWTPDGNVRHATYVSLRSDKPARAVRREQPVLQAAAPAGGANHGVKVTHGERVIDAASGLTKLDLVRYYESVSDWILPHLKGRPCSLVRGPDGVAGPLFFQKHGEKIGIPGITELDAALWPKHAALLEVGTVQALVGSAQMNVIEFHTWNSLARKIDAPDRMIFDLDPGEGTDWKHVQEAATLVRGFLTELGLQAWLKTSGGKGLHVVVPLAPRWDYDTVKAFSQAIVEHLAQVIPSRFVAKSGPANRVGKLFVDYLRNGHGATTATAFSARARPGLGVSMPIAWDDLPQVKSGAHWTVATAREHLSFQTTDPWAEYWQTKQNLTAAMKGLGFTAKKSPAKARR